MIRLTLKENFPELKYLCTVLNRLTIQGMNASVQVNHSMDTYYVRIESKRRKRKYSFVSLQQPLENLNTEELKKLSSISKESILIFETDEEGSFISINEFKKFNEIPYNKIVEAPQPPQLVSLSIDQKSNIQFDFVLRKRVHELDILKDIFNILIYKKYFCMMSLKKQKHLELNFFAPTNSQYTLAIGVGLWLPKKDSKLYNFWEKDYYEKSVMDFNQLSSRLKFRGKFYISDMLERPSLEFRAILEQSE